MEVVMVMRCLPSQTFSLPSSHSYSTSYENKQHCGYRKLQEDLSTPNTHTISDKARLYYGTGMADIKFKGSQVS